MWLTALAIAFGFIAVCAVIVVVSVVL
jgi:hypothetical protein